MIKPTVGRVVLFTPNDPNAFLPRKEQERFAAIICCVWGDECVNIAFFDANGIAHNATSVLLIQDDAPKPSTGYYCEWMEYQKGQAAKTEELEKKLNEK